MLDSQNISHDALLLLYGRQHQGDLSPTHVRLAAAYGKAMTVEQIAAELEYSATYVAKKIGAAGYEHLPWVKAIAPHRRKRGLRWVYATEAVAKYLDSPQ